MMALLYEFNVLRPKVDKLAAIDLKRKGTSSCPNIDGPKEPLTPVVLDGGHTTLKLFSAGGFKNFNIIHPPSFVKIDTKARPHGLKVNCDAVMIHATD